MRRMKRKSRFPATLSLLLALFASIQTSDGQEVKLALTPEMVINQSERGNPQAMVDEQELIGDPPAGEPQSTWKINSMYWRTFPYSAHIDLGTKRNLSSLRIFDTFNSGNLVISTGEPGNWRDATTLAIRLPDGKNVTDAATGEPLDVKDGKLILSMYPCQLRAVHVQ